MSEKLLSGACNDCPLRDKIDCDVAVVKNAVTHSTGGLQEWTTPVLDYISYELTDLPDDRDARRIELRTLRSEKFASDAEVAVNAAKEIREQRCQVEKDDYLNDPMYEIVMQMAAAKAKRDSLTGSLAESITSCEGPEKDEDALFLRRKKCGADIVGRVIPRYVMKKRNYDKAMLKIYGAIWTGVERLDRFKSIR